MDLNNNKLEDQILIQVLGGLDPHRDPGVETQFFTFTEEDARILNEKGYNVIPGKVYTLETLEATRSK